MFWKGLGNGDRYCWEFEDGAPVRVVSNSLKDQYPDLNGRRYGVIGSQGFGGYVRRGARSLCLPRRSIVWDWLDWW